MELAETLRALLAHKIALAAVVAAAFAAAVAVRVSSHPLPTGAATMQVLVDSPASALADLKQDTVPLTTRAPVFAQFMASEAILQAVGHSTGIPASQITAEGPFSGPAQTQNTVTPSEARSVQVLAQKANYRLTFVAQDTLPIVTISAQAPNPAAAAALANGVYTAVTGYVQALEAQSGTAPQNRVTIRQLGPPQAGAVNASSAKVLMAAAFLGVLIAGLLLILGVDGLRRRRRRTEVELFDPGLDAPFDPVEADAGRGSPVGAGATALARPSPERPKAGARA